MIAQRFQDWTKRSLFYLSLCSALHTKEDCYLLHSFYRLDKYHFHCLERQKEDAQDKMEEAREAKQSCRWDRNMKRHPKYYLNRLRMDAKSIEVSPFSASISTVHLWIIFRSWLSFFLVFRKSNTKAVSYRICTCSSWFFVLSYNLLISISQHSKQPLVQPLLNFWSHRAPHRYHHRRKETHKIDSGKKGNMKNAMFACNVAIRSDQTPHPCLQQRAPRHATNAGSGQNHLLRCLQSQRQSVVLDLDPTSSGKGFHRPSSHLCNQ